MLVQNLKLSGFLIRSCVLSGLLVAMLLKSRAVFSLGLRMCSTHVAKGPLVEPGRPSSGKIFYFLLNYNLVPLLDTLSKGLIQCNIRVMDRNISVHIYEEEISLYLMIIREEKLVYFLINLIIHEEKH